MLLGEQQNASLVAAAKSTCRPYVCLSVYIHIIISHAYIVLCRTWAGLCMLYAPLNCLTQRGSSPSCSSLPFVLLCSTPPSPLTHKVVTLTVSLIIYLSYWATGPVLFWRFGFGSSSCSRGICLKKLHGPWQVCRRSHVLYLWGVWLSHTL